MTFQNLFFIFFSFLFRYHTVSKSYLVVFFAYIVNLPVSTFSYYKKNIMYSMFSIVLLYSASFVVGYILCGMYGILNIFSCGTIKCKFSINYGDYKHKNNSLVNLDVS